MYVSQLVRFFAELRRASSLRQDISHDTRVCCFFVPPYPFEALSLISPLLHVRHFVYINIDCAYTKLSTPSFCHDIAFPSWSPATPKGGRSS
jgi:hypothetical protein